MGVYRYLAVNAENAEITGTVSASNVSAAERLLQQRKLVPLYFKRLYFHRRKQLDSASQIMFLSQLAQLVEAGVPLLQGLSDLQSGDESGALPEMLGELRQNISSGNSLSESLQLCDSGFPAVIIAMIRSGEDSGNLAESLQQSHKALVWQKDIAGRLRKAVFYPLLSGLALLLVSVFLLTYLVPRLSEFINSTGQDLPWYSLWLIRFSDHVTDFGPIYLGTILVAGVALLIAVRLNETCRLKLSQALFRLLWIGPVLLHVKTARFTYFSALLYSSGIPIIAALDSAKNVIASPALEKTLSSIVNEIRDGSSIGDSFRKASLFPPFVARMVVVGESTGGLDKSLLFVSTHFRQEADRAISRFEQMIGPTMTLIVGFFLIWVILAVLGPIYGSIGELGLQG